MALDVIAALQADGVLVPSGGDDTAMLQAACAAGGVVKLGVGVFTIQGGVPNGTLQPIHGTTIRGAGRGLTTILLDAAAPDGSMMIGLIGAHNVTIESLTLDGNNDNLANPMYDHSHGVWIRDFSRGTKIRDCHLRRHAGDSIYMYEAADTTIVGNRIDGMTRNCITWGGPSRGTLVRGNWLEKDLAAYDGVGSQTLDSEPNYGTVHDVVIQGNVCRFVNGKKLHVTATGRDLEWDGDPYNTGWVIDGNVFENGGVYAFRSVGTRITNNYITGVEGRAIHLYRDTFDPLVSGNYIEAHVEGETAAVYAARVTEDNQPQDGKIVDNTIVVAGGGRGITLQNVWRFDVRGNTIRGDGTGLGIYLRSSVGASCKNIAVEGNLFQGWDTDVHITVSAGSEFKGLRIVDNWLDDIVRSDAGSILEDYKFDNQGVY